MNLDSIQEELLTKLQLKGEKLYNLLLEWFDYTEKWDDLPDTKKFSYIMVACYKHKQKTKEVKKKRSKITTAQ